MDTAYYRFVSHTAVRLSVEEIVDLSLRMALANERLNLFLEIPKTKPINILTAQKTDVPGRTLAHPRINTTR